MINIIKYLFRLNGRRNTFIMIFSVIGMTVMDLSGVVIIFPFLQVITNSDSFERINAFLGGGVGYKNLIFFLSISLVALYIIKTLTQSKLQNIQFKKLAQFTEMLTNSTISGILNARYSVFQEVAASQIAGTAYSNTAQAMLALSAIIQVVNESLVLFIMLLVVLFFQPIIAVGTIIFSIIVTGLLYYFVVRHSFYIGESQRNIENARYRLLFSIASAIRDIKIMGLDGLFETRNKRTSLEYANIVWRYNYNASLPRLVIEFLAILSIVALATIVVVYELPMEESGPLLGLMAAATIRVIPAFSRLFSGITTFRSSAPFVEGLMSLNDNLKYNAVVKLEDELEFNDKIELVNVGFKYAEREILKNINLYLKPGESIGIVGASGAGKTTLLDLFTGLQPASEGKFLCDGFVFDPFLSHSIQKLIGYVPQTITLLDETIAFNVSFEDDPKIEKIMLVLKMANLGNFIAELPKGVQTQIGENGVRLSGGQRQRLGIARALYRSPKILVFDEATSALDTKSETELTFEIEKLHGQVSTIIVAHRLSTIINCDRIYVMSNGRIEGSGSHSELLLSSRSYKQLYESQDNRIIN